MTAWRRSTLCQTGECVEAGNAWRKSSRSLAGNCTEVGNSWRKSSLSHVNGNCVEARAGARVVLVRDTTDRGGPVLSFPAGAWSAFTASLSGCAS